jgi:hypothetical protein
VKYNYKWDNSIELGLIEGIDKYEIISAASTKTEQAVTNSISSQ